MLSLLLDNWENIFNCALPYFSLEFITDFIIVIDYCYKFWRNNLFLSRIPFKMFDSW